MPQAPARARLISGVRRVGGTPRIVDDDDDEETRRGDLDDDDD